VTATNLVRRHAVLRSSLKVATKPKGLDANGYGSGGMPQVFDLGDRSPVTIATMPKWNQGFAGAP
jgi:hypothetical protein